MSLASSLHSLWSGLMSVKPSSVPEGDFGTWIAASFVVHSILFFVLPASPWLPKEGGQQQQQQQQQEDTTHAEKKDVGGNTQERKL